MKNTTWKDNNLLSKFNENASPNWDDFEVVNNKERISKSQLKNLVEEGTHYLILHKSKDILVYQPLTWLGTRYIASKDVAPHNVEGHWSIAWRGDRRYWDYHSSNRMESFLILCTGSDKYALEISQEGSINYWDSEDRKLTKAEFLERITPEVPGIKEMLKKYVAEAIANHKLVEDSHAKRFGRA